MKTTIEETTKNKCIYCDRTFVRESTLLKHLCEQKTRFSDVQTKASHRLGFQCWLKFYDNIQPNRKRKKEIKDFVSSAYYSAFVKFGIYCVDTKVVNVDAYIDYLIKNNIIIDLWTSDSVYTKFLTIYLRNEEAFNAVKRSISNILDICLEENLKLRDFFQYFNKNKICQLIVNGKISPWLIYNSDEGTAFLSSLNNDHLSYIFEYIDPEKWKIKFIRDDNTVNSVKNIIKEAFIL